MIISQAIQYYVKMVKESRKWLYFAVIVFLLAALAGFIDFFYQPHIIETIFNFFQNLLSKNSGGDQGLVWIIFKQNLSTSLFALLGGVVFAVIPTLIVMTNGFIIGYVIHFLFRELPIHFWTKLAIVIITLLPHGMFELPIVLLSAALGIRWGSHFMARSSNGQRFQVWKQDAKTAILFIPLLVIILVIAAYIEVFVSGKLAGLYASGLSV